MSIRGSCLCGGVRFEVDPPFESFVNCHCSRCRKASGSAYAAGITVEPGHFRWLSGLPLVGRYDLPAAASFATGFCKVCGTPLPHATRSGRHVIVPAGALDDPLPTTPERHEHWRSRAGWYAHGDQLPSSD